MFLKPTYLTLWPGRWRARISHLTRKVILGSSLTWPSWCTTELSIRDEVTQSHSCLAKRYKTVQNDTNDLKRSVQDSGNDWQKSEKTTRDKKNNHQLKFFFRKKVSWTRAPSKPRPNWSCRRLRHRARFFQVWNPAKRAAPAPAAVGCLRSLSLKKFSEPFLRHERASTRARASPPLPIDKTLWKIRTRNMRCPQIVASWTGFEPFSAKFANFWNSSLWLFSQSSYKYFWLLLSRDAPPGGTWFRTL